jgi:HPt (histidine-containing phosphotransfer) domain-containing protein
MFLANGFNGFISKPIAVQELDKVLRELLSLEKAIQIGGLELAEAEKTPVSAEAKEEDSFSIFIGEVSKIEEINTEIGLGRFPGMKEVFRITVEMFYKKLLSECSNMTGYLAAEDMDSFSISIHAMKSSLATIGAMRLSEAAADLETASKKGETDFCQEKFPVLRDKLLALQKKLSAIFEEAKDSREKEPGDINLLREDTQKAIAAGEAFDDDTGTAIIKALLLYDFGGENNGLLESALTAFESFDFENALAALRKIE